jgi:hypothetical protein
MSSTRDPTGAHGHRAATADFYETPAWCVHRLMETNVLPRSGRWLEPSAGNGAIIRAVRDYREIDPDRVVYTAWNPFAPEWTAIELRAECRPDLAAAVGPAFTSGGFIAIGDYFKGAEAVAAVASHPFDVAIGNPPFSLARDFIERTVRLAKVTAFLLRLNYFGSEKRHELFRNWMPDLYVLPNRPSFREDGNTDSIEYAWFVWHRDQLDRRTGSITLLNLTPVEERRPQNLVPPRHTAEVLELLEAQNPLLKP